MKSLSLAFTITGLAILIFSFTNCGSGFDAANSSSSAALAANNLTSPGPQSGALKTYVSNSMNGPWVENGIACRGQISYFKTTGVDLSKRPKGCASPAASTGCLDLNAHRVFLSSEVIASDIVTSISAAESNVKKTEEKEAMKKAASNRTIARLVTIGRHMNSRRSSSLQRTTPQRCHADIQLR